MIMKRKICLLLALLLFVPVAAGAAAPPELARLRQEFTARWQAAPDEAARMDLLDGYIQDLTSLVYYMQGNSRSREAINAVRRELRRANQASLGEMDKLLDQEEAAGKLPAPRRKQTAPAPPQQHKPEAGQPQPPPAGAPDFSKNNVYSFTLAHPGSHTTLTYIASGRGSTDTYGEIYITAPDGKRRRAGKWRPADFDEPANEAGCGRLAPVTIDISGQVSQPGPYAVEFHWTDGIDPLVICRVKIKSMP